MTISDEMGICLEERFAFRNFSKEGYWDYIYSDKQFSPIVLFPGNSTFNTITGVVNDCDSFVLN
jgi:hypothetical protein